ncbi:MAG: sugar ABC transporter permease [Dictyoglomus sp. NZ13-RE01]|nr:MAG: sugar ABC transporter permease [Dictyoglomus sp. NZ13-RE01]
MSVKIFKKKGGEGNLSPLKRAEKRAGIFFLLPSLSILLLVIIFPLAFSLIVSFYNYTFIEPGFNKFVGFKNYLKIFSDPYFWNSLWVTFKFVFLVVSLEFSIGFLIALMLNRDIAFKEVYYTILTIPMVMSPVAVALIWKMLLHPNLGIINFLLEKIGLSPIDFLGEKNNAFWSVLLVDIWQQVSFMILMLLAGLVSLPTDVFEAAEIDGTSEIQKFFYITLPLMKPVIFAAITLRIIFAFRTFDLVYILTRGGPGVATDVLSYYVYRQTFMGLDLSTASSASYILLGIVMIFIVLIFKTIFRRSFEY